MRALVLEQPGPQSDRRCGSGTSAAASPAADEILLRVAAAALPHRPARSPRASLVVGAAGRPRPPDRRPRRSARRRSRAGRSATGPASRGWRAPAALRALPRGRENLCEPATFTGWDRDGGYAEARRRADFAVRPARCGRRPAPPRRCSAAASSATARCGSRHRARRRGSGSTASARRRAARSRSPLHWGCDVFVCTRSDAERARALELGARWAGGYDEPPPGRSTPRSPSRRPGDVVVAALRALDRGGTVAVNAIHLDRVPEFPYELLWWERSIRSVANVTRRDAAEFLELAARIPVRADVEIASPRRREPCVAESCRPQRGRSRGTRALMLMSRDAVRRRAPRAASCTRR